MSSSAGSWVHCNLCMRLGSSRLNMTSCGRVVCDSCCPKLRTVDCSSCRGPCSKTIALNRDAPTNIMNLFKDISDQMKSVFKPLAFQERQKQSIMDHKEKLCRKLQQEVQQNSVEIQKLDETLKKRKAQIGALEQKEASLRAVMNRLTSGRGSEPRQGLQNTSLQQGQMSSAFYAGMAERTPACSFLGASLMDTSRCSVGSGGFGRRERGGFKLEQGEGGTGLSRDSGFLQMKTPAAWHRAGSTASPSWAREGLGGAGRGREARRFTFK